MLLWRPLKYSLLLFIELSEVFHLFVAIIQQLWMQTCMARFMEVVFFSELTKNQDVIITGCVVKSSLFLIKLDFSLKVL